MQKAPVNQDMDQSAEEAPNVTKPPVNPWSSFDGKTCGTWECTEEDCDSLVQMPGPHAPAASSALEPFGYQLVSGERYHWVRKDLSKLLAWAICEVKNKFPQVTPIDVSDMSQADGKTPGTDVGKPRHPETTHIKGQDIDIAYYQIDGMNNYQIVCGDGSDTNKNGQPAKYNDGYFCTTDQNIVDWGPQVWFFAKLLEPPNKVRVIGIDQMLAHDLIDKVNELHQANEIDDELYVKFTQRLSWGAEGGWQFHHHHTHLSFLSSGP